MADAGQERIGEAKEKFWTEEMTETLMWFFIVSTVGFVAAGGIGLLSSWVLLALMDIADQLRKIANK